MKTIQSLSRKQAGLIGGAVFVLVMLVIVPWQVVAQESGGESKSAGKPPVSAEVSEQVGAADKGASPSPQPSPIKGEGEAKRNSVAIKGEVKRNSAAEKTLIGTWRGGPSGSDVLTINKDGTYTWLFRTDGQGFAGWPQPHPVSGMATIGMRGTPSVPGPFVSGRPAYSNNSGHWKLDGNALTLIYQPIPLALHGFMDIQPGMGTPQATDLWPTEFEASGNAYTAQLSIVRVDDSVLRMTGLAPAAGGSPGVTAPTGPKFFKRVDHQSATPTFAADVPKDQQHIAQLACLNAEEAKAMTKWIADVGDYLKNNKLDANVFFSLLDRIQSARAGKSDFAELFQLTDDEAKAYRDLNKLAGGFGAVCTLGDQGQLTTTELSALKKVVKFKERLDSLGNLLAMYVRDPFQDNSPMGGFVPASDGGVPAAAENPSPPANMAERQARLEMLYKLQTLFIELDTWIDSTVFN